MKIRRIIIWLIIAVVLITSIICFLNWPAKTSVALPSVPGLKTNPTSPEVLSTGNTNTMIGSVGTLPMPPAQTKAELRSEGLAELNDNEVFLYGKVQDQFSMPIVNATVSGIIQVNNGIRIGTDRMATVTDANGLFTISGYKGKNLGIHVAKNGYVMAATNTSFIYSFLWPESERFTPDRSNPTVIKMWKLQGAEPLVGINQNYKLHYTNAPIYFDLIAKQVVPSGGDIKIIVNRPTGVISERNPQDWGFTIEAVGGGVTEVTSKEANVTYVAPNIGYKLSDILTTTRQHQGVGVIQQTFYIKSRNGQVYSKLDVLFGINDTPDGIMYITFSGIASTNSSRNWEATAPQ